MTSSSALAPVRPAVNPWLAALYAALFTGVLTAIFVFAFRAEIPVLYILTWLLIGAGPILGYQLATGRLASDWKAILGGVLGMILPLLHFLVWPLIAGALTRGQNIGRLFLGSLAGLILAIIVFLLMGATMGQDPSWFSFGFIVLMAVWGGALGAAMVTWGRYTEDVVVVA